MTTKVLVAYASRHGATGGIAEQIATTLNEMGLEANARGVAEIEELAGYDAFVIGSAVYAFRWLPEAADFVRRNEWILAERPVWLFSSGPLGRDLVDGQGRDVRAEPKSVAELRDLVHPRDQRVFFGVYDPTSKPIGLMERLTRLMPGAHELLPKGDFRDWTEIEAWARSIAAALITPVRA